MWEIGNVPHHAYGQRHIEACPLRFRRGRQSGEAQIPTRTIIVIRMEALCIGILENRNQTPRLGSRLTIAVPCRCVTSTFIKILHMLPVIRES